MGEPLMSNFAAFFQEQSKMTTTNKKGPAFIGGEIVL